MGIGEGHAVRCEFVDIRGVDLGVRVETADVTPSKVVTENENDVGLGFHIEHSQASAANVQSAITNAVQKPTTSKRLSTTKVVAFTGLESALWSTSLAMLARSLLITSYPLIGVES